MHVTPPLILVGTRDIDFYLFVDHVLQAEHLITRLAPNLEEIRLSLTEQKPGAFLLDYRKHARPEPDIFTGLKQDTQIHRIPIIVLIDQGADGDFVQLASAGVSNIFVRPLLPIALIKCVRALLPATSFSDVSTVAAKTLAYADVEMDLTSYCVRRNGRETHLSPIEFKLLRHFLERPEQVVTREELHRAAWLDNIHVGPRTIDVHVGRLRKALQADHQPNVIRTIRSVGYALSARAPERNTGSHRMPGLYGGWTCAE
jgi:two-component system, OmpR family, phosphate regulon response regulator PhoB